MRHPPDPRTEGSLCRPLTATSHWLSLAASALTLAWAFVGPSTALAQITQPLPQYIEVQENDLLRDGTPSLPTAAAVSEATASRFFTNLLAEGIEHRYIVGSCEDRAQYITLMLERAGIPAIKVWAIAPYRHSLLSREAIVVRDPYRVTDSIRWGHHVAAAFKMLRNGKVQTVVVDRSFEPTRVLSLAEWLRKLNTPRAVYFFTGTRDYLFNSLNGLTVYHNKAQPDASGNVPSLRLPNWMPDILTGDFQKYSFAAKGDVIAEGMAENDVAMSLFGTLPSVGGDTPEQSEIRKLLRTEHGITQLRLGNQLPAAISAATVNAAQALYLQRHAHWLARLRALSTDAPPP